MRIDLDHLRVFYAVAKAGSFTAAGEALRISQSSVSRTIQILEDRIGFKLFIRHVKGLILTVQGERLLEYSSKIIEETDRVIKFISEANAEPHGELKITTTPHMGSSWLMPYLPGFLENYPNLSLKIICQTQNIDLSTSDVVIRTAVPHHPNIIQLPLKKFPMGLFASKSYLEKFGIPKTAEDLDNHRLLTVEGNRTDEYGNINWILNVGADPLKPRRSYLQINTLEGLINAAKLGLGIAELSMEWPSVKDSTLVPVLQHLNSPTVELFYSYPEYAKESERISALGIYLQKALQEEGPTM